jgi:hypothetical protein
MAWRALTRHTEWIQLTLEACITVAISYVAVAFRTVRADCRRRPGSSIFGGP